jgi:hypothetical protein
MRNQTSFKHGWKNPQWKGGKAISDKGYGRLMTREGRGKYEHRYRVEQLLRDPIGLVFLPATGEIPHGMHVHHLDGAKQHNCIPNLMLIQDRIHNALTMAYRTYIRDHMEEFNQWTAEKNAATEEPPDWVTGEF